jgi:hypothetical protein
MQSVVQPKHILVDIDALVRLWFGHRRYRNYAGIPDDKGLICQRVFVCQ